MNTYSISVSVGFYNFTNFVQITWSLPIVQGSIYKLVYEEILFLYLFVCQCYGDQIIQSFGCIRTEARSDDIGIDRDIATPVIASHLNVLTIVHYKQCIVSVHSKCYIPHGAFINGLWSHDNGCLDSTT